MQHFRKELNDEFDELTAFAEVMARSQNMITVDENGEFYVTAQGPLEHILPIMHEQVNKLERIKRQREQPR